MGRELSDVEMRTLTAWHEAGHAVALVVLGGVVQQARMIGGSGRVGGVVSPVAAFTPSPAGLLVVAMAGRAATAEYLVRVHGQGRGYAWRHAEAGAVDDMVVARREARRAGLSLSRAEDAARRLVRDRWRQVRAVAVMLDRHGSVSDTRVRSITGNPRPRGCAA